MAKPWTYGAPVVFLRNFFSEDHSLRVEQRYEHFSYLARFRSSMAFICDLFSNAYTQMHHACSFPHIHICVQVEQLHKIFKLCGTPSDEYWRSSSLPLAHMFRPHQSYESTLSEKCRDFPKGAVSLIEKLLSFDPHTRGTASSALASKVIK